MRECCIVVDNDTAVQEQRERKMYVRCPPLTKASRNTYTLYMLVIKGDVLNPLSYTYGVVCYL